jgi:hypothetical protein
MYDNLREKSGNKIITRREMHQVAAFRQIALWMLRCVCAPQNSCVARDVQGACGVRVGLLGCLYIGWGLEKFSSSWRGGTKENEKEIARGDGARTGRLGWRCGSRACVRRWLRHAGGGRGGGLLATEQVGGKRGTAHPN